jgi:hypothetical protein
MFLSFQNDKAAVIILGNVLLAETDKIEKLNFDKSFTEAAYIVIKLIKSDPEIFKQAVAKDNYNQEELEEHIKISKDIVFCHVFELTCTLNERLIASKTPRIQAQLQSSSNASKKTMETVEEEKEEVTQSNTPN